MDRAEAPGKRVIHQLMGKRVSSIMQHFFSYLNIVLEMFNVIKVLCVHLKKLSNRVVCRKS